MRNHIRSAVGVTLSAGLAVTIMAAPMASASPIGALPAGVAGSLGNGQTIDFGSLQGVPGPGAFTPSVTDRIQMEDQIRERINNYRVTNGRPAVTWKSNFDTSSRWWSDQIANHGKSGHSPANTRPFTYGGENVWYGNGVPWDQGAARAVDAWINSAGHRANLLSDRVIAAGIGAAWSDRDNRWVATYQFEVR